MFVWLVLGVVFYCISHCNRRTSAVWYCAERLSNRAGGSLVCCVTCGSCVVEQFVCTVVIINNFRFLFFVI